MSTSRDASVEKTTSFTHRKIPMESCQKTRRHRMGSTIPPHALLWFDAILSPPPTLIPTMRTTSPMVHREKETRTHFQTSGFVPTARNGEQVWQFTSTRPYHSPKKTRNEFKMFRMEAKDKWLKSPRLGLSGNCFSSYQGFRTTICVDVPRCECGENFTHTSENPDGKLPENKETPNGFTIPSHEGGNQSA